MGIENVTLSRIAFRYLRDSVTVILMAPSLQTNVMSPAVTEQITDLNFNIIIIYNIYRALIPKGPKALYIIRITTKT